MKIQWSSAANRDLVRLAEFLKPVNPRAAAQVVLNIIVAVEKLADYPEIAPRIEGHDDRDIRSLMIGDYNLHYEIKGDLLLIVRIWHGREDR
ncbi:plasmid stabilization system family protein [Asticcacaulis biprosthecium C19]|uniref:Plasmid stabilization system family protein n=1 Tax=Asticcacaulis biprosthecium C19 TaxID=715226 RepID=F4QHR5_9CAUL|nr:type II toxin-antitoxin system RelE/ParE family toxin [Asticcacaulis biprosthecium]EGF92802.1 plasmid stabilization system family protein [Asticcacaulis biprosthecium C19]